jgi:hypothetical protein
MLRIPKQSNKQQSTVHVACQLSASAAVRARGDQSTGAFALRLGFV